MWQQEPEVEEGGIWKLWHRPEIRRRCFTACVVWMAFGFIYYGVILLSVKVMGTAGTCSFEYGILSLVASRLVTLCAAAMKAFFYSGLETVRP